MIKIDEIDGLDGLDGIGVLIRPYQSNLSNLVYKRFVYLVE